MNSSCSSADFVLVWECGMLKMICKTHLYSIYHAVIQHKYGTSLCSIGKLAIHGHFPKLC